MFLILPTGFTGFFPYFLIFFPSTGMIWHRFPSTIPHYLLHLYLRLGRWWVLPLVSSDLALSQLRWEYLYGQKHGCCCGGCNWNYPGAKSHFCEFEIWRSMLWGSFTKMFSYYYIVSFLSFLFNLTVLHDFVWNTKELSNVSEFCIGCLISRMPWGRQDKGFNSWSHWEVFWLCWWWIIAKKTLFQCTLETL